MGLREVRRGLNRLAQKGDRLSHARQLGRVGVKNNFMTISEARVKIAELATNITALAVAFEAETGLEIHSIPVDHDTPHRVVHTAVKAQIRG